MDSNAQQNILKYFCPARRSAHRMYDVAAGGRPSNNLKYSSEALQVPNSQDAGSSCSQYSEPAPQPFSNVSQGTVTIDSSEELHHRSVADENVQERNVSCSWQPPECLGVEYSLETVPFPQQCSTAFRCINAETLSKILLSMSAAEFNLRFILVDCRYPFEYDGGRIKGAINLYDPNEIASIFFMDSEHVQNRQRIPIFYCEFSQKRSPAMAHKVRAFDCARNQERYPVVDYEEMYVLDGGYNAFYGFAKNLNLCEPNAYVKMDDSQYKRELQKYNFYQSRTTKCEPFQMDWPDTKRRRGSLRPRGNLDDARNDENFSPSPSPMHFQQF
uniref:protein-tyrosine-phosphatase n=1 Tax=Syphacia muris TaxID=451379 RepID=A0A0N5ACG6_9BILA